MQIDNYDNSRKEAFSYAYLNTLVVRCGYVFEEAAKPQDMQGTDIVITTLEGKDDGEIGRMIAQVKCTSQENIDRGDFLIYPLPIKNYKRLIKKTMDIRILILVLVPDDIDTWINISSNTQETLKLFVI